MNSDHYKEPGNIVCCSGADIKKQQGAVKFSCGACVFMQKWCYKASMTICIIQVLKKHMLC